MRRTGRSSFHRNAKTNMSVTVAEFRAVFTGDTTGFDKANLSVRQNLVKTAITAEETAEAMLHLVGAIGIADKAFDGASVSAATFTRVAGDAAKVAGAAGQAFEAGAKGAGSLDAALVIVAGTAKLATAEMGTAGTSVEALAVAAGTARTELGGLGRTLGSNAATGYAKRAEASVLAVESLGITAKTTTADIAAMNAAIASGKTLRLPSGGASGGASASALGRVESAGRSMAKLGLPVLAIGAAAVMVDSKFEAATARIEGFAGASHDEIVRLTPRFLALGEATGIMGKDVADGFFHIRSAIHDTASASDVLKVSAKAAAAGLGHMEEVSNVITSGKYSFGKTAGEIAALRAEVAGLGRSFGSVAA